MRELRECRIRRYVPTSPGPGARGLGFRDEAICPTRELAMQVPGASTCGRCFLGVSGCFGFL